MGFAIVDGECRILRCNAAFLANFGPDAVEADFLGHGADELLLEGDRPALAETMATILAGDTGVHELRIRLVHRPEETLTLSLAGQARPGGQSGPNTSGGTGVVSVQPSAKAILISRS